MPSSFYTLRRRALQAVTIWLLLAVPLGLIRFDREAGLLRIFKREYNYAEMVTPLLLLLGVVVLIGAMSLKKGRIFCSHICPMHLYLEWVKKWEASKLKGWVRWVGGFLFALLLTQWMIAFFISLPEQMLLIKAGSLFYIGVSLALLLLFYLLFAGYRQTFCKKACPYAFMQMMLRNDQTRRMEFRNPEHACTNCKRCDQVCPYHLQARFESHGLDCSNCNLCYEVCEDELGAGNSLFHLHDPEVDSTS